MTNKTKRAGGLMPLKRLSALLERWQAHEIKLNTQQRKRQWLLVMSVMALVFMVSLIWSPWRGLGLIDNGSWHWSKPANVKAAEGKNFEMPVDSFLSYLKNDLHERLSEKE